LPIDSGRGNWAKVSGNWAKVGGFSRNFKQKFIYQARSGRSERVLDADLLFFSFKI